MRANFLKSFRFKSCRDILEVQIWVNPDKSLHSEEYKIVEADVYSSEKGSRKMELARFIDKGEPTLSIEDIQRQFSIPEGAKIILTPPDYPVSECF